ncbi:mercuric resistance transcriptional repressor protein MerD [Salmonella enterica]|uniref:mercuric resistance transcriptional repressor MerD n=1 Tax=Enterobacterales TaxID=91347 RepID=UPI0006653B43|nr:MULTISPECIES: mercuric resistance transcriptional repressor MerD [Enterobacterales]ECW7581399.1 mercuric resistance transcriptional repressor protein MerD [Salmonella enterica]EFK8000061.1 mercuric resistance transcriptional repressor protein MerD [Escherichia coli]EFT7551272.1 mercuric resistance transcriptional repressor protein MerD [Salmonella enterica]EFT7556006.1 mercuric resistance transcriptional repressor protein MerD [Salmonella enterica]EFT9120948.1 mercuric resistance transcript
MSAYTVSQLAHNAGVSVHIVRDYLVRGLLRPVACTTGGYGVFDDAALQRLCFVRAALAHLDAQLASMPAERAHEEALP